MKDVKFKDLRQRLADEAAFEAKARVLADELFAASRALSESAICGTDGTHRANLAWFDDVWRTMGRLNQMRLDQVFEQIGHPVRVRPTP